MKKIKITLLLTATIFIAAFAKAQTADDIVNKYIDAVGGKDAVSKVNSVYIEASITAMGNESNGTTTIVNGKGWKSESEMMGSKLVTVYSDKGGWAINPFMGSSDAAAMPDEMYKAGEDQIFVFQFLDYASHGAKVELLGQEKVGDANTYKIKYTNKDNSETTFYFDANTYLIIKAEKSISMMGQDMQMVVLTSNYQKTDACVMFPATTEIDYGTQFSITTATKKIEVNKEIDPAVFDMPK